MLQLQKITGRDIYTFDLRGEITQSEVETFYAQLAREAATRHKLRVLGVVHDFPSFESFKALSASVKLKKTALSAVGRYAVLSDQGWVKTMLPLGSFVVPGIPVKYFAPQQLNQAMDWLETDQPDLQPAPNSTTELLHGTNILRITIDGQLTEAGVTAMYRALQAQALAGGQGRILVTFKDFDGIADFPTLLAGIKTDLASLRLADRCAVLTEKHWLENVVRTADFVTPGLELRAFPLADQPQAMAWLQE